MIQASPEMRTHFGLAIFLTVMALVIARPRGLNEAWPAVWAQGLHLSDRVAVEILDPETERLAPPGSAGEVVVSFLEPPYALLRFGTGDLSAEIPGPCPCGRTAPRLAGVTGRVGEAVKIRGLFVHPAELDRVMRGVSGVARYQVVVRRPDHHDEATLRLEVRPEADAAAVAPRAGEAAREGLRLRLAVEVVPPGTIEDGAPRIVDLRPWGRDGPA